MKKIEFLIILLAVMLLVTLTVSAQTDSNKKVNIEKSKAGNLNNQPKPLVKKRGQRIGLQLRQAHYHEKQVKKAHEVQKEVKKEEQESH